MSETVSAERDPVEARLAFERCIGEGGVAIFPADGLYGLACDPLRAEPIERIRELKARDSGQPTAVMYFSMPAVREIFSSLTPLVSAIAAKLLPGAVTLVVDNPERRYPLACGDTPDQLGFRFIENLLGDVVPPVFQTSANRSGEDPPARLDAVPEQIRAAADLEIDGGELTGSPSTVLDLSTVEAGGSWKLLREGGMPYAEIEEQLTGLQLGG